MNKESIVWVKINSNSYYNVENFQLVLNEYDEYIEISNI